MNKFHAKSSGLIPKASSKLLQNRLMLKFAPIVFMLLMFGFQMNAQITISGGTTATGSYATLSSAITALNGGGALTAPVIVDVNAGHTETLAGTIIMTITGTSSNTITIQKSGAGANPILTSHVGTNAAAAAAATIDGMFILQGSDYVTINGIDLFESSSNITATTQMEVGYGLFKTSATDGCNNVTIMNCSLTGLARLSAVNGTSWSGTTGIVAANATWSAVSTLIVPTSLDGTNSNNTFTNNTITGGTAGIQLIGYLLDLTNALCDQNNTVTNNVITDFGNATTNSAHGIIFGGQVGTVCSNNNISSSLAAKHAGTINGIFAANPNVGGNLTISNNTITVHGGGTTQNIHGIRVQSGIASATVTINSNTITGCTYSTLTSSSSNVGGFNGILTTGIANYAITNNILTNNNIGSSSVTTSGFSVQIMHQGGLASSVTVTGNTITGNNYGSATSTATGNFKGIDVGYGTGLAIPSINITGNTIKGHRRNGSTGGSSWGIHALALVANTNLNVSNNTIDSIEINGTAGTGGAVFGIQTGTSSNLIVDNNTISNLLNNKPTATGTFYGIYNVASPTNEKYRGNTISNIICQGTNAIYGINSNSTTGIKEISGNTVFNLKGTGAGVLNGIISTASTPSIFNNKVYDLGKNGTGTATTSVVGIFLATVSSGTAQIYNNMVSDIKANAASTNVASAVGIHLGAASNTRFNTVYLNNLSSTTLAANAGSCGIAIASTGTLQNNIVSNLYSSSGTGVSAAIRRTAAGTNGTAINTTTFGNNIYYQTPGLNNFVYAEGTTFASVTNSYFISGVTPAIGKIEDLNFNTSCGLYKVFMNDAGTFSEDNLVSAGANLYAPSGASYAESSANAVTTPIITNDFSGATRGTFPDMGALEFSGSSTDATPPAISYTNISNTICPDAVVLTATITDVSGVNTSTGLKPRMWFKKSTDANALVGNTSADNGWKFVEVSSIAGSSYTFAIDGSLLQSALTGGDIIQYFVVAQDMALSVNVGTNNANYTSGYCPLTVALDPLGFPVSGTIKSFTVLADPVTVTTVSSVANICVSGSPTLSLTGDAVTGAYYQWQSSPAGANTWTDISGANAVTYVSPAITSSTDFRCEISCGDLVSNGGNPITINNSVPVTINVTSPIVSSTNPATRCGTGTVTLGATAQAPGTINWYLNATGGSPVGTGNTYITPSISSTTTFYAASSNGGGSGSVGPLNPTIGTISASNIAIGTQRMFFNVIQPTTILSVDIFPTATVGSSGSVVIRDNTQTVLATVPYTTTVTGGQLQTITLNVSLPPGTGYEIGQGTAINLNRNTTGAVYPYNSSALVITGNTFDPNYYYFYYNWVITTGCESARVPVVATVIAPQPLTIAGGGAAHCNGAIVPLSVSSTIADYDSYLWSPTTDLYTDAAATIPYTGTSETTVYVKSTNNATLTYTCDAFNSSTSCANVASTTVKYLPATINITGSNNICLTGTVTLAYTPTTSITSSNIQWNDAIGPISGATGASYTTPTLTASTFYSLTLKDDAGTTCYATPNYAVNVNNPQITSTTPATRCGTGTVNLAATTASPSSNLVWFASNAPGSLPIGTGSPFTTPSISSTTTYYVAAADLGGQASGGRLTNLTAGGVLGAAPRGVTLTALAATTIDSFGILVTGNPGTITVQLHNGGTVSSPIGTPQTYTIPANSGSLASPLLMMFPSNIAIPAAGTYRLFVTAVTGTSPLFYEFSGVTGYPYNVGPDLSINGSVTSYTSVNSLTTYYYFYKLVVQSACVSPLQPVTATVTTSPAITASATSTTVCSGTPTTLSASSSNDPDYTYTWNPGGLTGASVTVNPTSTTTYTVTALDNTAGPNAGCGAEATVSITVNPITVTINPSISASSVICGSTVNLVSNATAPGYVMNAASTTPFIDISATGTDVPVALGDDTEHNISIPTFTFNGVPYTTARVGVNGLIVLGSTAGEVSLTNATLPSTANTAGNIFLAPYWDDLDIQTGLTIKTQTVGNTFIIQYTNAAHNAFTTGGITFQAQFDLISGVITYVYNDVIFGDPLYDAGINATVGLQISSTSALQHSFNTASLTNGQAISFSPNVPTLAWTGPNGFSSALANPTLTSVTALASGTYTITATGSNGCSTSSTLSLTVTDCNTIVNLTALIEGYVISGSSPVEMQPVGFNQGVSASLTECDAVTVEFHESTAPYALVQSVSAMLNVNGQGTATFTPVTAGSYYLVVKHRTAIDVWSDQPVTVGTTPITYNFTTAASQAYGGNMVEVSTGVFAMFSGDIDHLGSVESVDFSLWEADANNFAAGYLDTDLDGLGSVESVDYSIWEANANNFVGVVAP